MIITTALQIVVQSNVGYPTDDGFGHAQRPLVSLGEVEIHATIGGPQIANNSNCTVTDAGAGGGHAYDFVGQQLLDGYTSPEPGHVWIAFIDNGPVTLTFKFPSPVGISEVMMRTQALADQGNYYGGGANRAPGSFLLRTLEPDGVTWTTRRTVIGATWGSPSSSDSYANAYALESEVVASARRHSHIPLALLN